MAKVRQDAWSHEDDLLLAETVLRHVREGSTQLNAFEEVGDDLNRTSAACGFRWNAEVRKNYEDAMELAKRQRKERKRALQQKRKPTKTSVRQHENKEHFPTKAAPSMSETSLSMNQVIQFLQNLNETYQSSHQSKYKLEQTQKNNKQLSEQVEQLKKELQHTEDKLEMIQEDYQTFIQIMDRARKLTVFEGEEALKTPKFKMDKNGNLEQVAQGFE